MRFFLIFLVGIIITSLVGLSNFDDAFAQTYNVVLTLDPIPSKVALGDVVVFSGKFSTTSGQAIPNETIYIKAVVPLARDKVIAAGVTDNNGKFNVSWIAHENYFPQFPFYFYASYEGQGKTYEIKSSVYSLTVDTWFIPSTSIATGGGSKSVTTIELDKFQYSVYVGEYVTFTGKVLKNGNPVAYAPVEIKKKDPSDTVPIQTLAETRTDSDGKFKITWRATAEDFFKDQNVYAQVYNGAIVVDRTPSKTLTVLKHGGSISLDSFPSGRAIGDIVTFSGKLKLDKGSTEGQIVYIKNKGILTFDHLLTAAYVKSNGEFTAKWSVRQVDLDKELEIYAVFEGNDDVYRLTTCDKEPTGPLGSGCPSPRPFRILKDTIDSPESLLEGGIFGATGDEYMKLKYSLDFSTSPKVAIIPSPDSYDIVRDQTDPIEEGIRMWEYELERTYGGDWNVDVEVVTPGSTFSQEPDIFILLITPQEDDKCFDTWYGWIKYSDRPVFTWVCSSYKGEKRPDTGISATAAHEFIHATGLGHTFNKPNDMMCSSDWVTGVPTCPNTYWKSKDPSSLNLAAVVKLYGTDGYKNPNNNNISWNLEFRLGDPLPRNTPIQPTPIQPIIIPPTSIQPIIIPPTSIQPIIIPPKIITNLDSDNDGIPDSIDQCDFQKETFNGYKDTDGCPDTKPLPKDSDQDGIADIDDTCPYKAEVYNGYIDWDGCPDKKDLLELQEMDRTKILKSDDIQIFSVNKDIVDVSTNPGRQIKVTVALDHWQVNEGVPKGEIFSPSGTKAGEFGFKYTKREGDYSHFDGSYLVPHDFAVGTYKLVVKSNPYSSGDPVRSTIPTHSFNVVKLSATPSDNLTSEKPESKPEQRPEPEPTTPVIPSYGDVILSVGSALPGCEKDNSCFVPHAARIQVGQELRWVNTDSTAHTVTSGTAADGPDGVFDSGLFMAGDSFEVTFDEAGTFEYFCMVHPWMSGEVFVSVFPVTSTSTLTQNDDLSKLIGELNQKVDLLKQIIQSFFGSIFG